MKVGINLLLWTGNFSHDEVELFRRMAKLGFDGVEIPLFSTEGFDTSVVKNALEDAGMKCTICTVMPPDGSLIDPDPANRQNGVDYLKRIIDVAEAISCETICGPMHSPVGRLAGRGRIEVEWSHAVQALKNAAIHAEAAKVPLAIEPLNRFETYFLNIVEDVLKLVDEVGSPAIGLHYDTFHANIEEKDPVAAIRNSGSKLFHVHCSENDRGIVGTGHVPWDESFAALKEIGYNGWLTIESFLPAIKEIAAAAAIWRELAPSADILAKESADFIRAHYV